MFNVRLAGDHLYGKSLYTWMSLVMSLMVSYFVLPFSHELSWMRSGTELNQFLRIFLPTFAQFFKRFLFTSRGGFHSKVSMVEILYEQQTVQTLIRLLLWSN